MRVHSARPGTRALWAGGGPALFGLQKPRWWLLYARRCRVNTYAHTAALLTQHHVAVIIMTKSASKILFYFLQTIMQPPVTFCAEVRTPLLVLLLIVGRALYCVLY